LANYLENPSRYLSIPNFYEEKRDFFLNLIKDSKFQFMPSKGTYFQLLDYSKITDESDIAFAEKLTKEFKLATIPTSVFNKNQADFKQLRVCFAKTNETLQQAAAILNNI
ncbi:MAG TPA: methionine aminotransferase, partial [Flavobacteriaceae bacterium]|nr:methionine aminotransferase [Flavobacteriaceae bacterium]